MSSRVFFFHPSTVQIEHQNLRCQDGGLNLNRSPDVAGSNMREVRTGGRLEKGLRALTAPTAFLRRSRNPSMVWVQIGGPDTCAAPLCVQMGKA